MGSNQIPQHQEKKNNIKISSLFTLFPREHNWVSLLVYIYIVPMLLGINIFQPAICDIYSGIFNNIQKDNCSTDVDINYNLKWEKKRWKFKENTKQKKSF